MGKLFRPSKELCACGRPKSQVAKTCFECRKHRNISICVVCGTEFSAKASKRQQTCSRECAYKLRADKSRSTQSRKVALVCKWCGRTKYVSPAYASRQFCSHRCAYSYNSGERNPQWKGGITPEHDAFYSSSEWKEYCRIVWARDRATCQRCGAKYSEDQLLYQVHHIGSRAKFPELRTSVDNLVLLCRPCHRFVHSRANTAHEFVLLKSHNN